MVFWTSTFSKSNGCTKDLEHKIKCKKLMLQQGNPYCRCKCWHWESEMSIVIFQYLFHRLARFEHYRIIWTKEHFLFYDKKASTIFGICFSSWNNCVMLRYQIKDFNLSVFKKDGNPAVTMFKVAVTITNSKNLIKKCLYPEILAGQEVLELLIKTCTLLFCSITMTTEDPFCLPRC